MRFGGGQRRPFFFAVGLVIGAAWYSLQWHEPSLDLLVQAFGITLVGYLFSLFRRFVAPVIVLVLLVLVGVTAGALAGKMATLRVSHPVITSTLGPVMVEGWVEDVEPGQKGPRLRLIVHAIDDVPPAQLPGQIRLTHRSSLAVESGRFVRCWAVLRPPPAPSVPGDYAFHRQAYYQGLGAVGYVQGRCRGGTLGDPANRFDRWKLTVSKMRRRLAHFVKSAAGDRAGGFAAALASGDRSFMAYDDQEALRGSGLAHLLAISGLHMGIVGGLVFLMIWRGLALIEPLALRVPVRKPAALGALTVSLCYLILSGASVSTQRAFIMAAIMFGAVLFDRAAISLRSLSIALIIVTLLAPWSVLTPGFQMSFAATGALIATYEAWQRRRRTSPNYQRRRILLWSKSLFVTSLVSGLATAPFALYHFERVAGLGLIANLAAMPIISLISAPLAGAAFVLAPFGLSEWPLRLFGMSLEAVLSVAHTFSALEPPASGFLRDMPPQSLAVISAGMALVIIIHGVMYRFLVGLAALACATWFWSQLPNASLHWAPSGEVFLTDRAGETQRIELHDGDGLPPLKYSDVPVTLNCESRYCSTGWAGGTLLLISPDIASGPVPDRDADAIHAGPPCAPGLYRVPVNTSIGDLRLCPDKLADWSSIQRQHGRSWVLSSDGSLTETFKPPCNKRPWHPCSD